MKNLINIALSAVLVMTSSAKVMAQRSVPAAYQSSYNQMMNKANLDMANRQMMNNFTRGFGYAVNNAFDFKVFLKDGSVKEVKSKIYPDTANHSSYLLLVDKKYPKNDPNREQRIYAKQTSKILRYNEGLPVIGISADSCWLFKVLEGKINAYSFLSELNEVSDVTVIAFQYADGDIKKLTPNDLEPIIKSDEKAYRIFNKKDYYKSIKKFNKDQSKL